MINSETKAYPISGRGRWSVIDSVTLEGKRFFLMRNDKHSDRLEKIVMDENGSIIIDNDEDDLDPYIINRLMQYLHNGRTSIRDKLREYRREAGS